MAFTKIAEEVIEIRVEGDGEVIRAYGKIIDAYEKTEQAQKRSAESTSKLSGEFSKLEKRLMSAGGAAQVFETGMRAAAAAVRMLSAPVDLATSFEREFNLVRTLSNEVTSDTRRDLLELAARTPQTASQIATAAYNSLSRGVREADLIGFLETAAGAATAGNTDITTASESLLKSLSAFKGQGETVGAVADKVFTAVKLGATNFTELNASLGQGLAVASYGVKLEELLSVAGTLTKTLGVSFGEAIVRTNGLINVVTGSTDKNRKALKALGVEYGVSAIRQRGLAAVLDDVRKKSNGSAEALANLSGNKRAREGLLGILSGTNYAEFTKFLDGVTNSAGGFGDALGKVAGDAKSAQAQFKSLQESVLRELGEAVLPQLNRVLIDFGEYLKDNRTEMVGTFKEVADAVVELGQFIVNNGDRIAMLVGAMFSSKVAFSFAGAVAAAGDEIVRFGTKTGKSWGGLIAKGLTSPAGLGLVAGAAMILYDVFDDNFNTPLKDAMKEVQREIAGALDAAAKARGFASGKEFESRTSQARAGERLGLSAQDESAGNFDTPEEFLKRYEATAAGFVSADEARAQAVKALREEVKKDNAVREERLAGLKKELALAKESAAKFQTGGTLKIYEQDAPKEVNRLTKEIQQLNTERFRLENLANEAVKKQQAPAPATDDSPVVAQRTAATSKANDRIAAMNASFREREARAEIAGIEDKNTRLLVEMDRRHNAEIEAATKHSADLQALFRAQDAEQELLRSEIAERNAQASADKMSKQRTAESEYAIRVAEVRGQDADAEFLRRVDSDQNDIERLQAAGVNTLALEGKLAEDRLAIHKRFEAQKKVIEIQGIKGAASAMGSLFGNVKALGTAVGASQSVIGKLEGMMLLSRAAFHTASAFGEYANAASATAMGLVPKAIAHKIAAVSHGVAAAAAGVQAGIAFAGGGGSAATSMSAPAQSPTGPITGQRQQFLTEGERQPAVQFGDIHLSSIPSLLSREGASEMGRLIASDVAKELRAKSNIKGTARLPSRVIRR